jgi:hypothetical protein
MMDFNEHTMERGMIEVEDFCRMPKLFIAEFLERHLVEVKCELQNKQKDPNLLDMAACFLMCIEESRDDLLAWARKDKVVP